MCSGTASLPMSWSSAAVLTPWISLCGHPQRPRQAGGVDLDAADVALRRLILGVDGQRQRLDRREVQIRNLLDVALLILDASQVDLVGAVDEVDGAPWRAPPSSSRRSRMTHAPTAAASAPTK